MTDTSQNRQSAPLISIEPKELQEELETAHQLAQPLRARWEDQWIAVFSCGVNGEIFRPEGVGRPQNEKIDEDLRDQSLLFCKLSAHLQKFRSSGGRMFLRKNGAYTWDGDSEKFTCFLRFPSDLELPPQVHGASKYPSEENDANTDKPDGNESSSSLGSADSIEKGLDEPRTKDEFVGMISRIPSIGRKMAREIWRHGYRSRESLESASVDELSQVLWLGEKTAKRIKTALASPSYSDSETTDSGQKSHSRSKPASETGTPSKYDQEENEGVLANLITWARITRNATTVADLARVDFWQLLSEMGVSEEQAEQIDVPISKKLLGQFQLGEAFADALDSLEERRRAILLRRTFSADPETLASIAKDFDVSRERIRQLETKACATVTDTVGERTERIARSLRNAFGPVSAKEQVRRAVYIITADAPAAIQECAGRFLLNRAGYEFDGDVAVTERCRRLVQSIEEQASQIADERGIVSEPHLKESVDEEAVDVWDLLVDISELSRLFDSLVLRETNRTKVVLALKKLGEPSSRDQIAEIAGLDSRPTASILSRESDIVRVTKDTWGFENWTDDVYDGVAGEIVQRIEEDDGETTVARLLSEIPERFNVSPNTVQTILATEKFYVNDGKVLINDSPDVPLQPLGSLDEIVWDQRDRPVFRFKVKGRYLRGHSIKIPNEVAAYLGIGIDGRKSVSVANPEVDAEASITWRGHDPSGPELGNLRKALEAIGAAPNQEVFLVLDSEGLELTTDGSSFRTAHQDGRLSKRSEDEQSRREGRDYPRDTPQNNEAIEKLKARRRIMDLNDQPDA